TDMRAALAGRLARFKLIERAIQGFAVDEYVALLDRADLDSGLVGKLDIGCRHLVEAHVNRGRFVLVRTIGNGRDDEVIALDDRNPVPAILRLADFKNHAIIPAGPRSRDQIIENELAQGRIVRLKTDLEVSA